MSDLPSFETDTRVIITQATAGKIDFDHSENFNSLPDGMDACDICGDVYKRGAGMKSHMRQAHEPKANTLYKSDMIRALIPKASALVYDEKSDVWVYNMPITFPEGFVLLKIIRSDVAHRRNLQSANHYSWMEVLLIKEDKLA